MFVSQNWQRGTTDITTVIQCLSHIDLHTHTHPREEQFTKLECIMEPITALSPLDGRYSSKTSALRPFLRFSRFMFPFSFISLLLSFLSLSLSLSLSSLSLSLSLSSNFSYIYKWESVHIISCASGASLAAFSQRKTRDPWRYILSLSLSLSLSFSFLSSFSLLFLLSLSPHTHTLSFPPFFLSLCSPIFINASLILHCLPLLWVKCRRSLPPHDLKLKRL